MGWGEGKPRRTLEAVRPLRKRRRKPGLLGETVLDVDRPDAGSSSPQVASMAAASPSAPSASMSLTDGVNGRRYADCMDTEPRTGDTASDASLSAPLALKKW